MLKMFEKIVQEMTRRTAQVAQISLFFAMAVIVSNVILRGPWKPVPGTVEMTEMSGAVLLGMGVAYTAMMKGHIAVGILVDKLQPRLQALVDVIITFIALLFNSILAREIFQYGSSMMSRGYLTGHLGIPMAPSIFLVAFGMLMLGLVLFKDLLKAFVVVAKGSEAK